MIRRKRPWTMSHQDQKNMKNKLLLLLGLLLLSGVCIAVNMLATVSANAGSTVDMSPIREQNILLREQNHQLKRIADSLEIISGRAGYWKYGEKSK